MPSGNDPQDERDTQKLVTALFSLIVAHRQRFVEPASYYVAVLETVKAGVMLGNEVDRIRATAEIAEETSDEMPPYIR